MLVSRSGQAQALTDDLFETFDAVRGGRGGEGTMAFTGTLRRAAASSTKLGKWAFFFVRSADDLVEEVVRVRGLVHVRGAYLVALHPA